jgi:hypothetical protein
MNLDDARFVTRGVTPEEKAAVLAVLDAQIDEESVIEHAIQKPGVNAWARSQRALREDWGHNDLN